MRITSQWWLSWLEVATQGITSSTATISTMLSPGCSLGLLWQVCIISHLFGRTDVCPVKISPPGVVVRRAGATARWIVDRIKQRLRRLRMLLTKINGYSLYSTILFFSYVDGGGVLLCGGRSRTVLHGDCLRFLISLSKPNKVWNETLCDPLSFLQNWSDL